MPVETTQRPRTETRGRPSISMDVALKNTLTSLGQKDLPVFNQHEEIIDAIEKSPRFILEAGTGSGKSTVTPILALYDVLKRNPEGRVIVTQPRIGAAVNIANYLGETMKDLVGYRHGEGKSSTENTRLEFVTEGILLNEITKGKDRTLLSYDTIILDEVHERSLNLDILMPLLKNVQIEREQMGKPLKVIITSATLDKEKMKPYFEGAAHKEVEGKMFEITDHFEESPIASEDIPKAAAEKAAAIHKLGDHESGDMLIFMPGRGEIDETISFLQEQKELVNDNVEFIKLTGGADSSENDAKIKEVSDKRRIFIATNYAETSLTFPSVRVVIDSGIMRQKVFNPDTGISGLETREHTQGNAKQRRGRAGRMAAGNVHYLFTKEEYEKRETHLQAEVFRTDMVEPVLLLKQLGIDDVMHFDYLDHPGEQKIERAIETLKALGALNPDGSLSAIGERMGKMGIDEPRYARMLVEAEDLGCLEDVALIVAMMQESDKDVFDRKYKTHIPFRERYDEDLKISGSDMFTRIKVWNEYVAHNTSANDRKNWAREKGVSINNLWDASSKRKDIMRKRNISDKHIDLSDENKAKITQAITVGFIDKVIVRKGDDFYTLANNAKVGIDNKNSVLSGTRPDTFISGNLRGTENYGTFAGMNMEVTMEYLKKLAPHMEWPLTDEEKRALSDRAERAIKEEHEVSEEKEEVKHEKTSASDVVSTHLSHQENLQTHIRHEEEKKRTKLQKIKDSIKALLRRLGLMRH